MSFVMCLYNAWLAVLFVKTNCFMVFFQFSIILFQRMFTFTTFGLLLFVISGVLTYPSIQIRESYHKQTKALRVGWCQFSEEEHTNCYVCARLYESYSLYKDCCDRRPTPMVDICQAQLPEWNNL